MLNPKSLSEDLRELCKLIDDKSLIGSSVDSKHTSPNTIIFECLSYIHTTFLPTLLQHNISYFQKNLLQTALLELLDVISLRCKGLPMLRKTIINTH
jgi:hypothetical protein